MFFYNKFVKRTILRRFSQKGNDMGAGVHGPDTLTTGLYNESR